MKKNKVFQCAGECFGLHDEEDARLIIIDSKTYKVCHWCARDGKY